MLRKRLMTLALAVVMTVSVFTGCGSKDDSKTSRSESKKTEQQKSDAKKEKAAEKEETKAPIEDGTYTAEFKTDSSMFHVNDAYDDKGTLTVKDGKMTIHISLDIKKYCKSVSWYNKRCQEKRSETFTANDGYHNR